MVTPELSGAAAGVYGFPLHPERMSTPKTKKFRRLLLEPEPVLSVISPIARELLHPWKSL
jgi:hypothetical protein